MKNQQQLLILVCLLVCFVKGTWSGSVSVDQTNHIVYPGDTITLTCAGSEPGISYYIMNRVYWDFRMLNGSVYNLTESFYSRKGSGYEFASERFDSGHYDLLIDTTPDGTTAFILTINGIDVTDNGQFICSMIDSRDQAELDREVVDVQVIYA